MMDAVLTLCNQRLRVKENTNQPEEFRYYRAVRARFMRHLSECLKPENGGVIRDVIWELEGAEQCSRYDQNRFLLCR